MQVGTYEMKRELPQLFNNVEVKSRQLMSRVSSLE